MRLSLLFLRAASLLVVLPAGAALSSQGQTFSAITGTTPVFTGDLANRVPSALPPHHKKTDAPLMYARIRDGVYSVDGMVGKVRLNYDVKAASYLYLFMPGVGTALVSLAPSADAVSVPAAYHEGQLTVHVADHTFNVTGIESLVNDRGAVPGTLFVSLDRSAWKLGRTPMLGYGSTVRAPFEWPGVSPVTAVAGAEADESAAPVPANLLPQRVGYRVPPNGTR